MMMRLRFSATIPLLPIRRSFTSMDWRNAAVRGAELDSEATVNTTAPEQAAPDQKPLKRSPSPSQRPKTDAPEDSVYILTLLTDHDHHQRMTALRNKYFPAKINKLAAHLTLFHALPGSKLDDSIIPVIKNVAASTSAFSINASRPFRLKHGFAISISRDDGSQKAQSVHQALQQPWLDEGFLSQQDGDRKLRLHYTLMNKVDDEGEIERALKDVAEQFSGDRGKAEGLALYRYDRGWWKHHQTFRFCSSGSRSPRDDHK